MSGLAMTIQGTFNAILGKRVDLPAMVLAVHVTGLAAAVLVYLFSGRPRRLSGLAEVPWYAHVGGLLGVLIVIGVAYALARTGVGLGVAVILAAQLSTGVVIDHFGWFGTQRIAADGPRLLGVILMIVGAALLAKRSSP
jgi:transporter family-2 protein